VGFRYRGAATRKRPTDKTSRCTVPLVLVTPDRSRSVPLSQSPSHPLTRSYTYVFVRVATHHSIRRTTMHRVSAHIPGGEIVQAARNGVERRGASSGKNETDQRERTSPRRRRSDRSHAHTKSKTYANRLHPRAQKMALYRDTQQQRYVRTLVRLVRSLTYSLKSSVDSLVMPLRRGRGSIAPNAAERRGDRCIMAESLNGN